MKTKSIQNGLRSAVALIAMLFGVNNLQAQCALDDAVLPRNYETNTSVSVEKQNSLDERITKIKEWIETEMYNEIKRSDLERCKVKSMVYIEFGKDGKVVKYDFNNKDCETGWLLDNVLKNAPEFKPITMNGYPVRMKYEIPITVEIR
jgi:hypothetical protein